MLTGTELRVLGFGFIHFYLFFTFFRKIFFVLSSFVLRLRKSSTLCGAIYSFVPSLSRGALKPPITSAEEEEHRFLIDFDRFCVFLLRFVIDKECAKNRTITQSFPNL